MTVLIEAGKPCPHCGGKVYDVPGIGPECGNIKCTKPDPWPSYEEQIGRKAFEGAKAVDPNAWMTPEWEKLAPSRQRMWIAAAKAVFK